MKDVYVIYWSQSGNTEAMANAVAEGINAAGANAILTQVSEATTDMVQNSASIAFGCPAMGAEVLEEGEMEPFIASIEGMVAGKTLGLFGSYGWGDGQWMRDWVERMQGAGATVVGDEGVIANDAPDDDAVEACKALGAALAK